jgi:AcrR family transcriptional regulator
MSKEVKKRRDYRSPRRAEQAHETRRRILEAARGLFVERGYAPTTIATIAAQAGVAPETVYAAFGSKPVLLQELIGVAVRGDDDSRPLLERPGPQAVRGAPDQRTQLRLFAEDITSILERVGPLFEVLASAAGADPDIAALHQDVVKMRVRNMRVMVGWLAAKGPLRDGLTLDTAAETVNAITSPHVYGLLTRERRWSRRRFVGWLGETLAAVLLPANSS